MQSPIADTRYRATPELRRQLELQGRMSSWLARQVGVSKSSMSRFVAGTRSVPGAEARLISALLGSDFFVLFELHRGNDCLPRCDADESAA